MGIPIHVVKAKMQLEGLDPTFIDKPPDELVAVEEEAKKEEKMVPVGDHPLYNKYFKMLKVR